MTNVSKPKASGMLPQGLPSAKRPKEASKPSPSPGTNDAFEVKISPEAAEAASQGHSDKSGELDIRDLEGPRTQSVSKDKNMEDLVDFYANKLRRAAKRLEEKEKKETSELMASAPKAAPSRAHAPVIAKASTPAPAQAAEAIAAEA